MKNLRTFDQFINESYELVNEGDKSKSDINKMLKNAGFGNVSMVVNSFKDKAYKPLTKGLKGHTIGPMTMTNAHNEQNRKILDQLTDTLISMGGESISSDRGFDLIVKFPGIKKDTIIKFKWQLFPQNAHNKYDAGYKRYWLTYAIEQQKSVNESINESKSRYKPFKKKIGPLVIQAEGNDDELDVSASWGPFMEGPMYIHPEDDSWENMLDDETDKNAKNNLKLLMAVLKKCLNAKGDIIADDKAIKNLDDVMDNLDDMGWENSGGHFFGGEMYNGWQYDDHGSGNIKDAMIASALYAYAKIETFLWWKTLNESINESTVISKLKMDMLGKKLLGKIKIGTTFVTDDGDYVITGYGPKANAFQEYEAEKVDTKQPCKVKLTAMYGVKLEVTDDPRSGVYRKEAQLNSIILESVNEAGKFHHAEMRKIEKYADRYTLKDGKIVYAWEHGMPGMAGEPMTVIQMALEDGTQVGFREISNKLKPKDKKELQDWIDGNDDENHQTAINWVR